MLVLISEISLSFIELSQEHPNRFIDLSRRLSPSLGSRFGLTGQPEKRLEEGEGRRRGGGRGRRVEGGMGRVLLPQTPEARGLG